MSVTYTYSISIDFNDQFELSNFHNDIQNSQITTSLKKIQIRGDSVFVTFSSALNSSEHQILDDLVTSHVADITVPKDRFFNVNLSRNNVKIDTYQKIGSFNYSSSNDGDINYIDIIGYKDESSDYYKIRVYDVNNNQIIAESQNLTNTESQTIDLGQITNVPVENAIVEVQAKVVGNETNRSVAVDQVIIYHDN